MSNSKLDYETRGASAAFWLATPLFLGLHVARILLAAVLMIVAPIVGAVLSVLAVTLALTACFFEWFSAVPDFPFWPMLGAALACAVARLALDRATSALVRS
jgi:hypothetical protein